MLADILLRTVPDAVRLGIASGDLQVYGSVVRSVADGRIIAHLQETSALSAATQGLRLTADTLASGPLGLITDGVVITQNTQIKGLVDAIHGLQFVQIAIGLTGIGVSVAGFALVLNRIQKLQDGMVAQERAMAAISRSIDSLRADAIATDFAALRTAAERREEGWLLREGRSHWQSLADYAHALSNRFDARAQALRIAKPLDWPARQPLIDAMTLAASIRITARLAGNELPAARHAARDAALSVAGYVEDSRISTALLAALERSGAPVADPAAIESALAPMRTARAMLAAIETSGIALVETLAELDRQGIDGESWVTRAHSEQDEPFLYLPVR